MDLLISHFSVNCRVFFFSTRTSILEGNTQLPSPDATAFLGSMLNVSLRSIPFPFVQQHAVLLKIFSTVVRSNATIFHFFQVDATKEAFDHARSAYSTLNWSLPFIGD